MPSDCLSSDAGLACDDCGAAGAFAFDGATLCADCYQARGSSCAGGGAEDETEVSHTRPPAGHACVHPALSLPEVLANNAAVPTQLQADRHRLNPNCCYQACAQCSSIRRLREFRAGFPQDWAKRLTGSARLLAVAREGN